MSATVAGSPGVGTQIGGIAAARAVRAASAVASGTGTHRATGMSRSWRMRGATSPAPTVAAARRATVASQASDADVCSPTSTERSQRAERSAGRRTDAGRIASPSGTVTSSDARWPTTNGSADEPHCGARNARCSALGSAVWAPSHPHRCRLPSTHEPTMAGAGRSSGRAAHRDGGGQRGRRLGTRVTLPRGCHAWPEPCTPRAARTHCAEDPAPRRPTRHVYASGDGPAAEQVPAMVLC